MSYAVTPGTIRDIRLIAQITDECGRVYEDAVAWAGDASFNSKWPFDQLCKRAGCVLEYMVHKHGLKYAGKP